MGFKYTSDTFQISASVTEAAPNTLTTQTINLNLDSLSREILVIQMVDMDLSVPELQPGLKTQFNTSLNDANVGVVGLSNSQAIAVANNTIIADAGAAAAVGFSNAEPRYAQMSDTPLFVSATDDLYLSVQGVGNAAAVGLAQVRIFARRARADADTYAAILTSQFNV
uniref:Uncharacterized protein n=1 Tax=uncultured marine virus TaxID=186617 RepID=S4TDT0_9VIRU|nr:hypothetical protein [uncultured marine virus]